MRTRVKICCISSAADALMAIEAGADALGFVSHMPSGPGVIPIDSIARIIRGIPPAISTFLLSSSRDPDTIVEQVVQTGASTVQLVDSIDIKVYQELKRAVPRTRVVQVIHVTEQESIEEAKDVSPFVDALLLDSGNPKLSVKVLGGTGRTHNWEISKAIVDQTNIPVFLAGGLRPDNVQQAIASVKPFGVDLCTGVRSEGKLDPHKLNLFFDRLKTQS